MPGRPGPRLPRRALLIAPVAALAVLAALPAPARSQSFPAGLFGGPYTLTAADGRTVTEKSFPGRHQLIFFGYTLCPDICPTDLAVIAQALDDIGPLAERLQALFVSIDPERDTPELLADYTRAFHPAILGLTGSEAQIAAVSKAFRVHRRVVRPAGAGAADYLVDHSSLTYLMDPDGRFITLFPHGTDAGRMTTLLRHYLG